jgi:hypothetical protein
MLAAGTGLSLMTKMVCCVPESVLRRPVGQEPWNWNLARSFRSRLALGRDLFG